MPFLQYSRWYWFWQNAASMPLALYWGSTLSSFSNQDVQRPQTSFLHELHRFHWICEKSLFPFANLCCVRQISGASLVVQRVKRLPARRETSVWSLGRKDLLEKEMATHSSILAWRIPWMEESGRLKPMGLQKVGHDWATSLWLFTFSGKFLRWPPVIPASWFSFLSLFSFP